MKKDVQQINQMEVTVAYVTRTRIGSPVRSTSNSHVPNATLLSEKQKYHINVRVLNLRATLAVTIDTKRNAAMKMPYSMRISESSYSMMLKRVTRIQPSIFQIIIFSPV